MEKWKPLYNEDGKVITIFNDFVVKYEFCNFKCKYCLNQLKPDETAIWKKSDKRTIGGKEAYYDEEMVYSDFSALGIRINQIIDSIDRHIYAPILRISGGEILSIKNIEEFLKKISIKYETVQIVTNGYYLTKDKIEKFSDIGNIQIHFSLDGHDTVLNGNRIQSSVVQSRLLDNLNNVVKENIPVEISCILTNANTGRFKDYLEYLMQYSGKVCVIPAPIRGYSVNEFFPDEKSVAEFSKIIDNYDKYKTILPPLSFMIELVDFMKNRSRASRCHVPKIAIQSLDTGSITPCPNGWTVQLGNVLLDEAETVARAIGRESIYSVLLHGRPRIKYCKECFTAYDISNLYIEGKITDEELKRMKLFAMPKTFDVLKQYKMQNILK